MIFLQILLVYYLWRLGLKKVVGFFILVEAINIFYVFVKGGYLTINLVVEVVLSVILVICLGEKALRLKKSRLSEERKPGLILSLK